MFKENELKFLFGALAGMGIVQLVNLLWLGFDYLASNMSYEISFFLETLIVALVGYYLWKKADFGKPFSNGFILIVVGSVAVYLVLIGQSLMQ